MNGNYCRQEEEGQYVVVYKNELLKSIILSDPRNIRREPMDLPVIDFTTWPEDKLSEAEIQLLDNRVSSLNF